VFSALVAAWSARREKPQERHALEWLETQPAPDIAASGGFARTPATAFVPPNDPETGRVGNLSVMPTFRRRQARRFPAFRPDDPIVQLVWRDIKADAATIATLNALAADTPYIGHSASLTRCRFRTDEVPERTEMPSRRIYRGRLAELERIYQAGRRPNPGEQVGAAALREKEHTRSIFADRWLVLEHVDGEMPDVRAVALVSKGLRCALMSGYKKNGQGTTIPAIVSGHTAEGAPLTEPHVAIVPLAFFGKPFADGSVFGFAVIPPGNGELLAEESFRSAVRAVSKWNEKEERRELHLASNGFGLTFTPSGKSNRYSLEPAPYVAHAKIWATCTPIVLDRHLKAKGNAEREAEINTLLCQACLNIGLPRPARVVAGKHSAVSGAPSAYPSARGPHWTRWRLPMSLNGRQLAHAVLQFDEQVRGPVILGAGRFVGLGLCRAIDTDWGAK
jgi:CRISPR-associated protein Csb2